MKPIIVFGLAAAALIVSGIITAESVERIIVKKPFDEAKKGGGKGGAPTILYHGGTVMTSAPVSVYVIYYGDVPAGTQTIVNTFFTDLRTASGSYYTVNDTYYDASKNTVPPTFDFAVTTGMVYIDNPPSQGSRIGSSAIPKIVQNAINTGGLPADPKGVYFVLTAPDVTVSGFCKSYCAYHTSSTAIVAGEHIRFALVPDPGNKCGGCDGNVAVYGQSITPNGDQGADEMTDSIMHELSETVTDPEGTAWFTSNGSENGDLCNYTYGTPLSPGAPNGATANVLMNGHYYLIQKIWTNVTPQHCAP